MFFHLHRLVFCLKQIKRSEHYQCVKKELSGLTRQSAYGVNT